MVDIPHLLRLLETMTAFYIAFYHASKDLNVAEVVAPIHNSILHSLYSIMLLPLLWRLEWPSFSVEDYKTTELSITVSGAIVYLFTAIANIYMWYHHINTWAVFDTNGNYVYHLYAKSMLCLITSVLFIGDIIWHTLFLN